MSAQVKPSQPGYRFSSADVARAGIPAEVLGRILLQTAPGQAPDVSQLLAAILKSQAKANSKYRPVPFAFSNYKKQMVLAENPMRNYLIIQNIANDDLLVLFEDGPASVQDFNGDADSQAQLANLQTRALRVVGGGYYEPLIAPTNPITLFTLNGDAGGVAIEGQ